MELPLISARLDARAAELVALLAARTDRPRAAVRVVRAPYRLCPIGAHVDHQFGRVCALAVDHALLFAFVPRTDTRMELISRDFSEDLETPISFDIRSAQRATGDWADHARGAVRALGEHGRLAHGLTGIVDGALGESGLSSSAAVGIAYLLALAACNEIALSDVELVRAQGRIEQGFLGLHNGLLDPAAVVWAQAGGLVEIDTRALSIRSAHPEHSPDATFVAVSSGQRAALVAGDAFNNRVDECLQAAAWAATRLGLALASPRLDDLPRAALTELCAEEGAMPALLARRARHFLGETARVSAGMDAWGRGDIQAFGALMNASAESSVHNYQTGSVALGDLLAALQAASGVLGARFSGAGYRGCCVALVRRGAVADVLAEVGARYAAAQPELAPASWALQSDPAAGAAQLGSVT